MKQEAFVVSSPRNRAITIKVSPGHFATSSSHISHYLDVSSLKTGSSVAREIARELAIIFPHASAVDTILCMENTEVIGAYLAEELLTDGAMAVENGDEIHVMTPMQSHGGQLIFQANERRHIEGKNILVLLATVASGRTVSRALDCLAYYGGQPVGILSLFSAVSVARDLQIQSLFTDQDIPGYHFARIEHCNMCRAGQRLEAIVNSSGYAEL